MPHLSLVTKNKIQGVIEYVLAALWLLASVSTFLSPPFTEGGFVVIIFGGQVALYIYGVWFAILGLWLIWSKITKRRKQHKYALFAMWLTTIYTASLATALVGFDWVGLIDDFILGAAAALCWLRWKLVTEYLDPERFTKTVLEVRDDLPPPTS